MKIPQRWQILFCLLASPLASSAARAALADPPHQDIHFLAEHVPEIAQDARAFSLPWPGEAPVAGEWLGSVQAGYMSAASGFMDFRGPMLAAEASYGLSDRWALEGLVFYGKFDLADSSSEEVLRDHYLGDPPPLDLPEPALFQLGGGSIRHSGLGLGLLRQLSPAGARSPWSIRIGLLFERLEAQDFRFDYRLLGGLDAGATGTLDHSFDTAFITPHFGIQRDIPLGKSWRLRPRLSFGFPLPSGDLDARLTGPGFDRSSTDPGGRPIKVGDSWGALGAGLLHTRSGIEIDLGSTLFFGLFGEHLSHASVEKPILLQVTWHFH